MNFINSPIFILLLAVVYLVSIYGLLAIAQILVRGNSDLSPNSKKKAQ